MKTDPILKRRGRYGIKKLIAIAAIVLPAHSNAADAYLAVPGTSGNDRSLAPFSTGFPSMRYQQVYSDSAFSGAGLSDVSITALYFKSLAGLSISNIQISLSTTPAAADSLSPIFTSNVGADDTTVYSGSLVLTSGPGPSSFTVLVTLQTPFRYQPGNGNLLLDVRNISGSVPLVPFPPGPIDFESATVLGDSVSRVFATDVGAASGTADTSGLLTLFVVDPIPEPSSVALLLLGTAAFWLSGRRRKLQRGNSSEACGQDH